MKASRGTEDWAYRCNPAGTTVETTRHLLDEELFLWRSLHTAVGHKVNSVRLIEVGDTIHVYFSADGADIFIGSYLVEQPETLADPDAPAVEAVAAGPLAEQLTDAGYPQDTELGCFTGFRVKKDSYARTFGSSPKWVARNAIVRLKR